MAAPSRVAAWLKTGRPATKLCMTAPCMRAPSKAVLRERERMPRSVTTQGKSGSNTMRSAGAPTARRPELEPEDFGRAAGHGAEDGQQRHVARMDEAERGGEQRFEADGAVGGLGEGLALDLGVLRIVGRVDGVDGARDEPVDHRPPVVLGAERRRELEEGAVGRDVVLVERQVVDRDAGRDATGAALGGGQQLDGGAGRDLRGVVADVGQRGELQVAGERDGLGLDRDALEAGDGGEQALVHHAVADQRALGGLVDDRHVEVAGIAEGGAQQAGRLDRGAAIGERDGARLLQQAVLGDLLAPEAAGEGGRGQHIDAGLGARRGAG